MNWLVWKDYRLNRPIVLVAIGLLAVPHLVAVIRSVQWTMEGNADPWTKLLASCLIFSSVISLGLMQLTLAFLGGNLIACERADRSAEFLSYLPISCSRIVFSKLFVAMGMTALIWLPNITLLAMIADFWKLQPNVASELPRVLAGIAATGLTFFCVAWLFSSIMDSPVFAICLGLLAPFIPLLAVLIAYTQGWDDDLLWWYNSTCVTLSGVSFMGGVGAILK